MVDATDRATSDSPLHLLFPFIVAGLALFLYRMPPTPFGAYCFAGSPILQWARRSRGDELAATCVLGAITAVIYFVVHRALNPSWIVSAMVGLGAASIAVVGFALVSARGVARDKTLRDLAIVSVLPLSLLWGIVILVFSPSMHGLTYDRILTAVDRSLGFDPSFEVGRAFRSSAPLRWIGLHAYDAAPLAVAGVAALRWRQSGGRDSSNVILGTILAGQFALLLFQLLPACGPVYMWGARFPFDPPTNDELGLVVGPVAIEGFRNALPSVHMASAIMVVWAARPLALAWRVVAFALLIATVWATLGTGQHYLVDLVAALPLAVAAYATTTRERGWRVAALIGLTVATAWVLLLRWTPALFAGQPGVTWLAVVLTVVGMTYVQRRHSSNSALHALIGVW